MAELGDAESSEKPGCTEVTVSLGWADLKGRVLASNTTKEAPVSTAGQLKATVENHGCLITIAV